MEFRSSKQPLKLWFLLGVIVASIVGVLFVPAIPQDPAYHNFADGRAVAGIPNFWNVLSNFPFFVVGVIGLISMKRASCKATLPALNASYFMFFVGVFLTGFGSSYYHWSPSNLTLVWDRLPMTISFMAFFAVIVGENISPDTGRRLLWSLLFVGLLSVVYWHITESQGRGDLRLYALVQFLPMLLIPLILLLFRSRFSGSIYIWSVIGCYVVSKIFEHADQPAYQAIGIGGHALKHLAAAAGTYCFYLALRYRDFLGESQG